MGDDYAVQFLEPLSRADHADGASE
jgi:hypothetical protein